MSESLFGIDVSATSLWSSQTVAIPAGIQRNRACASDWARDRRNGIEHRRDGYLAAILRNAYGRN